MQNMSDAHHSVVLIALGRHALLVRSLVECCVVANRKIGAHRCVFGLGLVFGFDQALGVNLDGVREAAHELHHKVAVGLHDKRVLAIGAGEGAVRVENSTLGERIGRLGAGGARRVLGQHLGGQV